MDLNKLEELDELEITVNEIEAIKLIDVDGIKYKKCAKKMNLSIDEFNDLINNVRKNICLALLEGKSIKIIEEKPIKEKITTVCKFRCAVCGEIYTVDYTKDKIVCSLCFSSKVMASEEAGFF